MKTPICPPCGCSLVRLGISKDRAVAYSHNGKEFLFCCKGCVDIFIADPEKYLQEISNLVVCPVCLKEKPIQWTNELDQEGTTFYFCRCPHCVDEFKKKPEHFMKRLAGVVE